MVDKTDELRCPVCGGTQFVYDYTRGELICTRCGYVIEERNITTEQEWRAFTYEEREKRARTGPPISRHTPGSLSTEIDWRSRDASGKELDAVRRAEMHRLRKWQARVQTSMERTLSQASIELERLSSHLGLPSSVIERAFEIYKRALENGLLKGRPIEPMVAASIYAACRELKLPRTLDEISRYTRASRKDVARCFRLLLQWGVVKAPLPSPVDYIPRIASQLGLSATTVRKAMEIINSARKTGITIGKDPAGLAAAAIYLASLLTGEVRTQKAVAQAAQVTEVTVRNRYRDLARKLGIQTPVR